MDEPVAIDAPLDTRGWAASAAARVPAAVWLSGMVAVSAVLRIVVASTVSAPAIFPDEIIYSELAKSIGSSGRLLVRDVPFAGLTYGPLYALLIAPVYRIPSLPTAYAAVKVVNSVVISLAAIPTYLIARRVVHQRSACIAAALSLLIPGVAFSSRVMTESLAYPIFLLCALTMLRVLEAPSLRRQLEVLLVIGIACLVRAQAVVLVPVLVSAVVTYSIVELSVRGTFGWRALSSKLAVYRPTIVISALVFAGAAVADVVGSQGAAGGSSSERFDYIAGRLRPLSLPAWLVYHVAVLDLAVGVAPFVALVLLASGLRRRASAAVRAFIIVTIATTSCLVLLSAVFATQPGVDRVQERYMFYVQPLVLIAFLVWVEAPASKSGRTARLFAALAVALPLILVVHRVLNAHVFASAPTLVPWLYTRTLWGPAVTALALTFVGVLGLLALLVRDRGRLVAPIIAYLILTTLIIWGGFESRSQDALAAGVGNADTGWIDRAVGRNAHVAVLWTGLESETSRSRRVWVNEFFNRSVGTVYYSKEPMLYNLPQTRVRLRHGVVTLDSGEPLRVHYVLSDGPRIAGVVVAKAPGVDLTLYRVTEGPVRLENP